MTFPTPCHHPGVGPAPAAPWADASLRMRGGRQLAGPGHLGALPAKWTLGASRIRLQPLLLRGSTKQRQPAGFLREANAWSEPPLLLLRHGAASYAGRKMGLFQMQALQLVCASPAPISAAARLLSVLHDVPVQFEARLQVGKE